MKQPKPVTIDFETFPIRRRPHYPPAPVGVSIKYPGKPAKYWAWGHPSENNCTWAEAQAALAKAYEHKDGILCHNAKFDLDVAEVHMGLKIPEWQRIHETMFLLFLDDPHQRELGLKPSADRLLGMAPEERDAVVDWLMANQPLMPGKKLGKGKQSKHPAPAYVAYAPGKLVGTYANGDVERTEALFKTLWPKTQEREMLSAYDRERELLPALLDMERTGVRVDLPRLRSDVALYHGWLDRLTAWVRHVLHEPELNIDSGPQLVAAMFSAGKADRSLMGVTPRGAVQTTKDSIAAGVTDKVLAAVLTYRTQLGTCVGTFMETWLAMAEESDGLIFTNWNQVKGDVGTRTGRLSSTPNFQNIPKEFSPIFDGIKCPWKDLPPLPLVRGYIIPWEGDLLLGRDYSQQELRILGHFEGGVLMDAYSENPWLDVHDYARDMINQMTGKNFARKPIKNTGFGLIYGMGLGKLAIQSSIDVATAKEVKDAYLKIFPGLKDMYRDMKTRAAHKTPIRTWGGREYYCEEPKIIENRLVTFDYKMLNVLIQGSAADCTKEAVIRFYRVKKPHWKLVLQVHDELVMSVPREEVAEAMGVLQTCMESVEFDVQILSEGDWSADNWNAMNDYDTKGTLSAAF